MTKHDFTSVHWERRLSNKISTTLAIVSLKYTISPKLIWDNFKFCNNTKKIKKRKKNSLHF